VAARIGAAFAVPPMILSIGYNGLKAKRKVLDDRVDTTEVDCQGAV